MSKVILVSRCAWTLYNFRSGHIRSLREQGAHTVLGAGAGGDGFEGKIRELGVPFIPVRVDRKGISVRGDLRLLIDLYQLYRREKPDIVHHFTIKPVIYGSMAARMAGVSRIINTVTGLGFVFTENKALWLRRIVEFQYRLAMACAHFNFFQNKDDLQAFLESRLVKPRKAGLLPGSGVDTEYFTPTTHSEQNISRDRVVFLMVARLLRDKGIYEFIEAARLVKKEYPHTRFQLLGGRDERNPTVVTLEELESWQREGVVEWLGQLEDVRAPLAAADVVVLPSYREGIPRSLLEAAAMGKPLITTSAVGCREVVDDGVNGYLVPVKDSKALGLAMRRMMKEGPNRHQMGLAGRAKVIREFDESLVIEQVMRAYEGRQAQEAGRSSAI